MHGERVDGDDLDAVARGVRRGCSRRAREERRPAVLEAVTYRYRGHSVADAGLAYRTKEEIAEHQAHDPIDARPRARCASAACRRRRARRGRRARPTSASPAAVAFAEHAPSPTVAELAAGMYAPGSGEQFARMRPGSPFGEEELVFDAGLGR